ncbi:hypothetical protein [Streptacidiphilus jiangxiensis]|uniref:Uncharacterized protein n=1 Tax=Streptacidiphilus jiangxiensis TaxID=235985 RepID=A0A1H7L7V8_STRJI|nr:hypothetical protein [Streptacidiphilus jiangxiensis]SEK95082.1 hypothetical protein SAMN05414137_104384 [Streptacidiphilus jiangxiensis]
MRYRSGGSEPPDGPDGPDDLWRGAAARDQEMLAAAAFPLHVPTAPVLSPVALTEYQLTDGELVKVELVHGDWFAGPSVQVVSLSPGRGGEGVGENWALLEDLLATERERLREPGVARAATAEEGPAELVVDGVPVPATLRREGALWVARLRLPDGRARLLVTGRGVAPEEVALGLVEDLAPYAEGRQALLNELTVRRAARAKRQERSSGSVAEEPLGLADHRRLVDFCVADAVRVETAVRAHRLPVSGAAHGEEHGRLWERAVRQQMRLAGEDHSEADESVTALVNQISSLAQHSDWFLDPANADAAEAAIEESIRFTALAGDVRSAPAQHAWQRQWHSLDEPSLPGASLTPEERRLRVELALQARTSWLDLWRTWLAAR